MLSEAKKCLSSKNVNLCLLDSVESIAQGIKILQKTTGGSKVNPNSFGSEINSILVTNEKKIGIRGAIAQPHMSSYFALKIGCIKKTHTQTHTQSGAENFLFQF